MSRLPARSVRRWWLGPGDFCCANWSEGGLSTVCGGENRFYKADA